ncbi:membrane protein insertion efficiency factor YidD [Candidatus Uhrbacteria bacterium]|nr:membrane protein insertion efficiency factor YidD [Candidatus Uhrbacteria bacterium]
MWTTIVCDALAQLPKRCAAGFIRVYQRTISPDHSHLGRWWFPWGYCRYFPSCSEYTRRAVLQNGFFVGGVRGLWRILRCNPWSRGGIDVP